MALAEVEVQAVQSDPEVGDYLRYMRERKDPALSARALSRNANLSPAYVNKVESHCIAPSFSAFSRLAVELELTPQEVYQLVWMEGTKHQNEDALDG